MLTTNQLQQTAMVAPIDDITIQARQGSVAAIIQVLNEKLTDTGVRTRAVFAEGVLHLLCEASATEKLEQSILVEQIRQILLEISPRNIGRVKINSRIVKEQQLLWLEEISRNRENQLLWSQEITLAKPNIFQSLVSNHFSGQFMLGTICGISLTLLMLAVGGLFYNWLNLENPGSIEVSTSRISDPPSPAVTNPLEDRLLESKLAFDEAVRVAEEASAAGKVARTREDWLEIAAKWRRASELMESVSPEYDRYQEAVPRITSYRENSEYARVEADRR